MKNINKLNIILIGIIILITSISYTIITHQNKKKNLLEDKLLSNNNLISALTDTLSIVVGENGELLKEKKVMQTNIKELEGTNIVLTKNQKKLVDRVNSLQKKYNVISTTLIETELELKNIKNSIGVVDTVKNSVVFSEISKEMEYSVRVKNIRPYKNLIPELIFDEFKVYDTISLDFIWGDKKEGYPVSVMIGNSNKYVDTVGVDSYMIPNIKPENKKGFWRRTGSWLKGKKNMLIGFTIGIGLGVGLAN